MPAGSIRLENSSSTAGGGYLAGAIDWEYTQDIEANTSRVVANLFVRKEIHESTVTTPTIGTWECSLTLNGETVSGGVYASVSGDWILMRSLIVTVPHNDDGTKSVTLSGAVWGPSGTGYSGRSTEGSGTVTLNTIPRASTLSCGALTLGSKSACTITPAAEGYRHDLYLTAGGHRACLLHDVRGGTYQISPNLSDFAAYITTAKSVTGTLELTTYNAGWTAALGVKTLSVQVLVPASCGPSVSSGWASAAYYNAGTAAAGIAAYVQGYSKAQVTFSDQKVTTRYGATIKGYKIACAGVTVSSAPYRTQVLPGTAASIVCTVEDSRGYTASETLTVTLLPYARPKLSSLSLYRSDADGTADKDGTCIWARATLSYSAIGGRNACTLKGYHRTAGGSYGDGTAMESGVGLILTAAALIGQSYVAKIEAADSLGQTARYEVTIPTADAAFHLRAGGKGAAFGKYAEADGVLDVAWDLRVRGDYLDADGNEIDRVVEAGSSGIWRWRKWRSGFAECWGEQTYTGDASTAWGGLYALECAAPDYPIAFTDWPNVQRDAVCNTAAGCWLSAYGTGTAANCGPFALLRPTAMQVSASVKFYVTGHWK